MDWLTQRAGHHRESHAMKLTHTEKLMLIILGAIAMVIAIGAGLLISLIVALT